MADPLSVAAGLAALEVLVQQATAILSQYTTATKACPVELTNLLLELTSFTGHLQTVRVLQERRQSDSDWSKSFTKFTLHNVWADSVHEVLIRITDKLRPAGLGAGSRFQRLRWPLTRRETIDLTECITNAKNALRDAMLHNFV